VSVDELSKSFDEVGAINPIVVSKRSNNVVCGNSRKKTGKPWPVMYRDFKNSYEEVLFAAHENFGRRIISDEEGRQIVDGLQAAYKENFNRYLTQGEMSDRIPRSTSWVKQFWREEWSTEHPIRGGMNPVEIGVKGTPTRINGSAIDPLEISETPEIYKPIEATKKLLELRAEGKADPTFKEFKQVFDQAPKQVQSAFIQDFPDQHIMEKAKQAVAEQQTEDSIPPDVKERDSRRRRIVEQYEAEFIDPKDAQPYHSPEYLEKMKKEEGDIGN